MAFKEYPVRVGSMLFTQVDPARGKEVEYNRWYERDHFYAGCQIGAWNVAGTRFVATRDLKALLSLGNDVHAAVVVFFRDFQDLCRASNLGNGVVVQQTHESELIVLRHDLGDHFLVPRFENVQRKRSTRQQHQLQRK